MIAALLADLPSGMVPRARVIDHLLDLRGCLEPEDRHLVERTLADTPGITLVDHQWWVDCLTALDLDLAGAAAS